MDKHTIKRAVELCLAVYRVTDKFPESEFLRCKLRGLSVAVIESVVYKISYPKKELRVLFLCFDVADKQGWVDSRNYEILKREYTKLCDKITMPLDRFDKLTRSKLGALNNNFGVSNRLTERQKVIMDFVKNQEDGVTASVISKAIKKSSRTVLRELKILLKNEFIMRRGKTKGAKFFKT